MLSTTTLVIIDDDDDDRDFFCEVAKELTIDVVPFKWASEALEALEKEDTPLPEFIFLDLNMPAIGGKECLIALKKSPRLKPIKVVIYSTTKLPSVASHMFELGAFSFVTKPTRLSVLKDILSSVLKGQHTTR